jgi:hypothetical protein
MKALRTFLVLLLLATVAGATAAAQDTPPSGPFKAVHLTNLKTDAEVAQLQAAIADMNAVVAKAGYPNIKYRLFKVAGTRSGSHEYLWESSWPGADVYNKIHNSAAWRESTQKHQMDNLLRDEIYNRYIEVPAAKR